MTLEHVATINGVPCPVIRDSKIGLIVRMNGRIKTVFKSNKMVENNVLRGKFVATSIKRR